MTGPSERERLARLYGGLVFCSFCAVALWRRDLFLAVARPALAMLSGGGAPALWAAGQILFFGAILAATLGTISREAHPRRDALIALTATLAGWAAERWGTRTGLWSYYTGEQPPLWIVPAWPLGALFIDRVSARWRQLAGRAPRTVFWVLAAALWAVVAVFCGRRQSWTGPVAVALILAAGAHPEDDVWALAAGLACVLVADYWGTSRGCWAYYLHREGFGLWPGIAFGMAFDSSVVLGALKAAAGVDRLINFYLDFSTSPEHTKSKALAERRTS